MTCYHPIRAWRSQSGRQANGKWPLVFSKRDGYDDLPVDIPCGQCIGCRLERSRQWAMRCVMESQMHRDNSFITLTYRDEDLPDDGSVSVRTMQLFMKRLRKEYSHQKIRFFLCGEYGSKNFRPHYHALLFGLRFADARVWSRRNNSTLYRSDTLERLWPHGFSTIGDVTFDSAAYCARYVLKKVTGQDSREHYGERHPEFVTMSRRPGIGAEWYARYQSDVYPGDTVILRDGVKMRPPKYFDRLFEESGGDLSALKIKRSIAMDKFSEDSTLSRMSTREELQQMRADMLVRGLEEEFDVDVEN